MSMESEEQRVKRHRRRRLFDTVAEGYDAARRGYPSEVIDWMAASAGVGTGAQVLEIGCGTGQLTRQLVAHRFALTAIDIGPSMIEIARRRVSDPDVAFEVTSFEAFDAPDHSVDLIVSATAFHWIDPEIAWTKSARLLRPGGWIAVLSTSEKYDDPFGAALLKLWIERSEDGGAWTTTKQPTPAETIAETGLFDAAIVRAHGERATLPTDVVITLEHTRATSLSYDDVTRAGFTDELTALLDQQTTVGLEQQTSLTMAQVLPV